MYLKTITKFMASAAGAGLTLLALIGWITLIVGGIALWMYWLTF